MAKAFLIPRREVDALAELALTYAHHLIDCIKAEVDPRLRFTWDVKSHWPGKNLDETFADCSALHVRIEAGYHGTANDPVIVRRIPKDDYVVPFWNVPYALILLADPAVNPESQWWPQGYRGNALILNTYEVYLQDIFTGTIDLGDPNCFKQVADKLGKFASATRRISPSFEESVPSSEPH